MEAINLEGDFSTNTSRKGRGSLDSFSKVKREEGSSDLRPSNKRSNSFSLQNITKTSFLSRIYLGDFFACDFLIKMDLAKLHFLNGGFGHDNWDLTDGNNCLKLVSYQYYYN